MKNITYINAGAGSGKTYTLTHHLSDALTAADGVKPSEVILTTFTDAAAGEFREKARAVLLKQGKTELAAQMGSAAIGTVHSVCQKFVRKFWYDLGLSPEMDVMSEEDKIFYINQSIADVTTEEDLNFFEEYVRDFDVIKFVDNRPVRDYDFWKSDVQHVISAIAAYSIDDLASGLRESCAQVMDIFSYTTTAFPNLDEALTRLRTYKPAVAKWNDLRRGIELSKSYAMDNKIVAFATKGEYEPFFNDKSNKDLDRDAVSREAVARLLNKHTGERICECIERVFRIAQSWKEEYEKYKKQQHLLDFDDMEQYFLRLLTESKYAEQQKELSTYKLVMVDEFQDSNPVQVRIFKELARIIEQTGGRCEWVGDPKQSIYGFRGSDTELITEVTSMIAPENRSSLNTSFRSRPLLVKLVNNLFTDAFKGIVDDSMIRLDNQDRCQEELQGHSPFMHWHMEGSNKNTYSQAVAAKVRELLSSDLVVADKKEEGQTRGTERPVMPGDVAILCRGNKEVQQMVSALRALDIPVASTTPDILNWAEAQLVIDIMRYISDPEIPEVRASIVHLLENIPTESLLIDRLNYLKGEDRDESKDDWLCGRSLFTALDRMAARVGTSGIQDMVSTIILELGLRDVVSHWKSSNAREQNLSTLESMAGDYESHCKQLRLTPTIAGFISWISVQDFNKGGKDNSLETVKVMTYHRSKGLEWKVVILESLSKDFANDGVIAGTEFTSVKPLKNASGEYYVHYVPSLGTPSEQLAKEITHTSIFPVIRDKVIAEEKRIMYVGMTRARDYLVTTSYSGKTEPLLTLEQCEIANKEFDVQDGKARYWRTAGNEFFADYSEISPADSNASDTDSVPSTEQTEWKAAEVVSSIPKMVSPSRVRATEQMMDSVKTDVVASFGYLKHEIKDEAGCGTCIHNIFAAYRPGETEWNRKMAEGLVKAGGFENQITDIEGVISAEDHLFEYLEKNYGKPSEILRETPFTLILDDAQAASVGLTAGQNVRGEIDLVWMLADGSCVLVDYKSYPRFDKDINAPEVREHYAGYIPQLTLYTHALQSAGFNVKEKLIYYPLQGRIVKFSN